MNIGHTTPILRIFDEAKAKEFYIDYLGFKIDWEHRFAPNLPLYLQISQDNCILHLTEHHGDCCPGAALRIQTTDIDAFHQQLQAKQYKYANPAIEDTSWNSRDLSVKDPFGNRLTFTNHIST